MSVSAGIHGTGGTGGIQGSVLVTAGVALGDFMILSLIHGSMEVWEWAWVWAWDSMIPGSTTLSSARRLSGIMWY